MTRVKTISIEQLKPGMFIVWVDQPWYRTPFLIHKRLIRHTGDINLLRQCGVRELKIDPDQGLDLELPPQGESPSPVATEGQTSHEPSPPGQPSSAEPLGSGNTTLSMDRLHPAEAERTGRSPGDQPSPSVQKDNPANQDDHTRLRDAEINSLTSNTNTPASATPDIRTENTGSPIEASQPGPGGRGNAGNVHTPIAQEKPPSSTPSEQAAAAKATYHEAVISMERMFEELEGGIGPRPETIRVVVSNILSRILDSSDSMLSLLFLQKMQRFDRTLASHALDVCTLSLIVARAYGVADKELELLGAGALLHDIGYIRLPRNLYRRTQDLSGQEGALMQQHPALGLAILREAKESRDTVIRIVLEHHEYANGTGFPHKLQGDSLSALAQLVGLVDTYDGMVSRRGGRPAMLPHDAIRQLFRLGDTGQYAKDLIQAMISSLGVYPIGSLVLLNTGEHAVVVAMNPAQRLKPIIKVITGAQGEVYLTPARIDLGNQEAADRARTITKVLDPLRERVNVAMFLDGLTKEAA